jgi:hypothetical protein
MSRLVVNFIGATAAGVILVPGLLAGDQVLHIMVTTGETAGTDVSANFSNFVITTGSLFQITASDLSSFTCYALIERCGDA